MTRRLIWTDQAKADLRAIDRRTALDILHGLARFIGTDEGDVRQLRGKQPPEFRLRLGDYRLRFHDHGDTMKILRIRHRKDVYRD